MFMNDNLNLQLDTYYSIEDYHYKALFVEKLLYYYRNSNYTSKDKTFCQRYWETELEELYYISFRFF
ncbi:hypothetical protein 162300090 [Organic Lake phycodnavirus 2]|nr:hypothetical protein 162300090 [Organic Lake phycodnavirus 2]